MNPGNNDYHLKENSQAIDIGTSLVSDVVTVDLDKVSRPQGNGFDIGSYEFNNVTSVKSNLNPNNYMLYQNFPNPFNPSTDIRFRIAKFGFVTLKIYNILGREVATLVIKELSPGSYNVKWDASKFSSGIYFYQIKAGNFYQTKKMLLLK